MNVEFSEPEYGLVLHVDGQIIRLVGGMPYLDLFAYNSIIQLSYAQPVINKFISPLLDSY